MSLVGVARRVVISTNQWPGVGALYTRAYDLGLASVVARLSAVDGVLAVLLRVNDDGHRWVPGLSDYDLTVIAEPRDAAGAIRFLDDLWGRYRSIKRWVPQLGEMDIMDAEGYRDLLDFGPMPTWSLKRSRPLFVKTGNAEVCELLGRPGRLSRPADFLLDALMRFGRYVMPAWLDHSARGTGMTARRAEHLLANVVLRLGRLGLQVETATGDTLARRMARVLQAMSTACGQIASSDPGRVAVVDPRGLSIPENVLSPIRTFCEDVLRHAAVSRCSAVVWIPYMGATTLSLQFVVPDNSAQEDVVRVLDALALFTPAVGELFRRLPAADNGRHYAPEGFPLLGTSSVWRRWRELSPFDGVAVAATGRVLVGADAAIGCPPSWCALQRNAENRYVALLPIKNDWRRENIRPGGQLYAAVINHANGYASAFTDAVATAPVAIACPSIEDGYEASTDALRRLGARLRAAAV